ncbi:MAG: chromosome partitioning protein [Actinomycetota bacterium]|nr:chromosome partitioning protein [Actinomycetota bacterium]
MCAKSDPVKVVAAYNIKGGVGKTSTAVNLAYLAARDGFRTLLWDLDPQGSATYLLKAEARVKGGGRALVVGRRTAGDAVRSTEIDRLDLIPADFSYRNLDRELGAAENPTKRLHRLLTPLRTHYDVVVLDCPPSASLMSESIIRASDVLLVPLIPTGLSLRTFDQLTEFVGTVEGRAPQIVGFLSMVDRRKRSHRDLAATVPRDHPGVRPVVVPSLAVVEQMAEHRTPVPLFAPASPATAAYEQLWDHVREAWS